MLTGAATGAPVVSSIGVGRAGKTWTGTSYVNGKYLKPAWSPPAEVREEKRAEKAAKVRATMPSTVVLTDESIPF